MIKRKPLEIPPAAVPRFLADMRVFHSTDDTIKRDEIAARQLHFTPSASTCPATQG